MFRDKLSSTLRTAVVKLLRKGLKDPTLTGNYRPISLLSVYYNPKNQTGSGVYCRKATKSLY